MFDQTTSLSVLRWHHGLVWMTNVLGKSDCSSWATVLALSPQSVQSHNYELLSDDSESRSHLMLEAWSVNSVATREKYFCILIQRLGLGMQPLCAWMAWIRAISLAISLRLDEKMNMVIMTGLSTWNENKSKDLVTHSPATDFICKVRPGQYLSQRRLQL